MRLRRMLLAGVRGLALAAVSLCCSVALFVLCTLSLTSTVLGVGVVTTPPLFGLVGRFADWRRRLAAEWAGVHIDAVRASPPEPVPTGLLAGVPVFGHLLRNPATWRQSGWLATDMTAGSVSALLAAGLVFYPLEGYALAAGLWRVFTDGSGIGIWYGFVPVQGQATALLAGLLAAALSAVALFAAPLLLTLHFRLTKAVLGPSEGDLHRRVDHLTRTRHEAVDFSAAELRRIERDLHDGAQARLVAMGMSLGAVEALIEKDPTRAKELVAKARSESADALDELRDLVRGIHPPVLAERGLGPALEALALRTAVPVEVDLPLPGRAAGAIESAAYFAVSEVLTNAAKHAKARRVWLDAGYRDGMLHFTVTDDGRGGADAGGSGLRGVARRLGAFDGVLAVHSPEGGPTMVTMEIPCVLDEGYGATAH